jgi:hypothetical protein
MATQTPVATKELVLNVFCVRFPNNTDFAIAAVEDTWTSVQVFVNKGNGESLRFEDEFRHLRSWAAKWELEYYEYEHKIVVDGDNIGWQKA